MDKELDARASTAQLCEYESCPGAAGLRAALCEHEHTDIKDTYIVQ